MIHFLNAARSRLIDASVNNVRLLIYIMPRLICIIDSLGLSGDCVTLAFEFPSLFVVVDVVVDAVVVFAAVVVAGVAGVAVVSIPAAWRHHGRPSSEDAPRSFKILGSDSEFPD